jgi:hypothetical protein
MKYFFSPNNRFFLPNATLVPIYPVFIANIFFVSIHIVLPDHYYPASPFFLRLFPFFLFKKERKKQQKTAKNNQNPKQFIGYQYTPQ